jgi:hypothetical protein
MAFFSEQLEGELGTPNFGGSLLLLIDGKLMGDGMLVPKINFRRGIFSNDFSIRLDGGWVFKVHYSRPFFREAWWKLNAGGTLDYYPVDFIEQLVGVVAMNRPHWLIDDQS